MAKTSYGELKKLTPVEAAYIAGILDGEGTVSLIKITKRHQRRLVVTIANTDLQMLEWIKRSVGAGQLAKKKSYSKKHSLTYTYRITNRQAFNLLAQIHPYLKAYNKKERTKLILKNYIKLTPRNGKYSPQTLKKRNEFIKKFFLVPFPGIIKLNPRKSPLIEKIIKQ